MLAHADAAAQIVAVVLLAMLLLMYAKGRAMQALVDRLTRRVQPRPPEASGSPTHASAADPQDPVKDSSGEPHEPTTGPWMSS